MIGQLQIKNIQKRNHKNYKRLRIQRKKRKNKQHKCLYSNLQLPNKILINKYLLKKKLKNKLEPNNKLRIKSKKEKIEIFYKNNEYNLKKKKIVR